RDIPRLAAIVGPSLLLTIMQLCMLPRGLRAERCQWTRAGADAPTAIPQTPGWPSRQETMHEKREARSENLSVLRIGEKGKNHERKLGLYSHRASRRAGKRLPEFVTLNRVHLVCADQSRPHGALLPHR